MLTFRPTGFPQMSWIHSKQLAVLRSVSHHAAGAPNPGTDKSEHQRQGSGESSRMSDKAFSKIACRRWSIDYSDHHSWSQPPQPFHVLCFCTHPKTRHCRHPRALHGNRTTTVPQMYIMYCNQGKVMAIATDSRVGCVLLSALPLGPRYRFWHVFHVLA